MSLSLQLISKELVRSQPQPGEHCRGRDGNGYRDMLNRLIRRHRRNYNLVVCRSCPSLQIGGVFHGKSCPSGGLPPIKLKRHGRRAIGCGISDKRQDGMTICLGRIAAEEEFLFVVYPIVIRVSRSRAVSGWIKAVVGGEVCLGIIKGERCCGAG